MKIRIITLRIGVLVGTFLMFSSCRHDVPLNVETKKGTTEDVESSHVDQLENDNKERALTKEEAKKIYMQRIKAGRVSVQSVKKIMRHDRSKEKPIERTIKDDACVSCPIVVVPGERLGPINIGMTAKEVENKFREKLAGCNIGNRLKKEIVEGSIAEKIPFKMMIDGLYELIFDKDQKVISVSLVVNNVHEGCLEIDGHRMHRTKYDLIRSFNECHDMHLWSGATHVPCENSGVEIVFGHHGKTIHLKVIKKGLTRRNDLRPFISYLPEIWDEALEEALIDNELENDNKDASP